MESVEISRQIAASLHHTATSLGCDPQQPYLFAVAEANRRGIDVEKTVSGATILNKGRASYIPSDALIIHENAGTPFEQAFLVAHEIGHAELGDTPDGDKEAEHEIDPTRSAEPSPLGFDRVVDYGRRQRREVQMDLFAREFLLPRPVVRKLHVDEGLTASAIARQFGAPFEVVVQQLIDALFLPPIAKAAIATNVAPLLNAEQILAASHRGKAYLLEAGPGTGKTQTLAARVAGLLSEGVDPRRILLLTFSNKAAAEMASRIAISHKEAASAIWIGTFHAFGLDLIRRFYAELGLPEDPQMMDRTEALELMEREFPHIKLRHFRNFYDPTYIIADILAAISRAKDEVIDAKQYLELAESMLSKAGTSEDREAAEKAVEVALVYEVYEKLKLQANMVDFGDLVSMPVRLIENNAQIRTHLRNQYDHVLVDEYQDVNRSSVRLLIALCGDGENLWVVGDARQSLYRFRGASSFNVTRFGREDFTGAGRGRLRINYRSTSEIIEAFSGFASTMKAGSTDNTLLPQQSANAFKPELRTVDQVEEQTVAIADAINEMRRIGLSYRDQAILCTGNEKLSNLGQELERLGLPVLYLGSLFERSEVKDLLALLSILTDRRAIGLVRIACWPEFHMPLADVATVIEHLRAHESEPCAWLQNLDAISGLSAEGQLALNSLRIALHGLAKDSHPWTALATLLLNNTRLGVRIAHPSDATRRTQSIAIWQLLNFIRSQPSGPGLPIMRLLDRVRQLVRLGDERDLRQLPAAAQEIDAVRLMTIHGAKGLEFPIVHIPGMTSDAAPRTLVTPRCIPPDGMVEGASGSAQEILNDGHAEEQECLFYVAMSRARDRLFLYAPLQKSNGHKRALSPFLSRLGDSLIRKHIRPERTLPEFEDDADIALSVTSRLHISAQQLSLYESCPRRFLYTHVLHVGGRRKATSFAHMHDAVRNIVQFVCTMDKPFESGETVPELLSQAFIESGLAKHGYVGDYKAFATSLLNYFLSIRNGYIPDKVAPLTLRIGNDVITIRPDDALQSGGQRTVRSIHTGHRRSTMDKEIGAAAFTLAVKHEYPDAIIEFVHLSDQSLEQITLSPRVLQNRLNKVGDILKDIRNGQFPAYPSPRICPTCPAFFICGPVPQGELEKNFEEKLPVS